MKRFSIALFALTVLTACDQMFPPKVEDTLGACSYEAQKTLAVSPLTGWSRNKATADLAAACMISKGFIHGIQDNKGLHVTGCFAYAPGFVEKYAELRPDCWYLRSTRPGGLL